MIITAGPPARRRRPSRPGGAPARSPRACPNRRPAARESCHPGGSGRPIPTWFRGCRRGNCPPHPHRRRSGPRRSRPRSRRRRAPRECACAPSRGPRMPPAPAPRRAAWGLLEINGVPGEGEGLTGLVQRLDLHGIGEIALPAAPPPPQLFQLFRALAEQPGTDDIPSRLAAAGVDRIRVTLASPETAEPPPPPPVTSSQDVELGEAIIPRASRPSGTDGILRGEPWRDIKSVPIDGVPLVSHDPPPPPAADALPGTARPASPQAPTPSAPSAPAAPRGSRADARAKPPAADAPASPPGPPHPPD